MILATLSLVVAQVHAGQRTPLELAILSGDLAEVNRQVSRLVKGATSLDSHPSALGLAVQGGKTVSQKVALIAAVLESGADPNRTLKAHLLLSHDPKVLRYLFERGLHCNTMEYGYSPLYRMVAQGNIPIVKELLRAGVKPSRPCTEGGALPLNVACYQGNLPMAKLLVQGGAKWNAKTEKGETALHAAVLGYQGLGYVSTKLQPRRTTPDFIKEIIKLGAPKGTRNAKGETAFDVAKRKNYTNLLPILKPGK